MIAFQLHLAPFFLIKISASNYFFSAGKSIPSSPSDSSIHSTPDASFQSTDGSVCSNEYSSLRSKYDKTGTE